MHLHLFHINLGLTAVFLTAPIIYYYYGGQSRRQFLDSEEKNGIVELFYNI